ncbi:MAG: sigma-70 family RNA polymerase sigma factor [Candidatus Desulfobacillus denitrificans]
MDGAKVTQLLARCVESDQAAWTVLVREFSGLVFALARRSGLREDACEEVAQTVFLELSRNIAGLREPKALVAWLMTSARRESWRVARRASRAGMTGQDVDRAAAFPDEPQFEQLERHYRIRQAFENLGERCRELLARLYLRTPPASYDLISSELGMPIGSIGPTRARCIARLAELIERNDLLE